MYYDGNIEAEFYNISWPSLSLYVHNQTLKRFASAQAGTLKGQRSMDTVAGKTSKPWLPTSREPHNNMETLHSVTEVEEDSTGVQSNDYSYCSSELFKLLKSSRDTSLSVHALVALPPMNRLGSVMAAKERKLLIESAQAPSLPMKNQLTAPLSSASNL